MEYSCRDHRASSGRLLAGAVVLLCLCAAASGQGQLSCNFYKASCPNLDSIVQARVSAAMKAEARMGASLLRLHFHDCFVNSGGPDYDVRLGRKDGPVANQSGANSNLPSPFNSITVITQKFKDVGLSTKDVVVLSGAHTIGRSRCVLFRSRLANFSATDSVDPTLDSALASSLQQLCSGGDGNQTADLDAGSADAFDNHYYKNLLANKGLLSSDQGLFSSPDGVNATRALVQGYSANSQRFLYDFGVSMVRMGNIPSPNASAGQIRTKCSAVN